MQNQNKMALEKSPSRIRQLWLVLTLIISSTLSQAQTQPLINSTLTGTVLSARTREPLTQAVVHIKGTTHTVETDDKGKFNFVTGQKFPYTLEITYVGFEKLEIVAATSPIEIALKES